MLGAVDDVVDVMVVEVVTEAGGLGAGIDDEAAAGLAAGAGLELAPGFFGGALGVGNGVLGIKNNQYYQFYTASLG